MLNRFGRNMKDLVMLWRAEISTGNRRIWTKAAVCGATAGQATDQSTPVSVAAPAQPLL